MQALFFTDEQLSALMRAATPLPPGDRTAFLEEVASKLQDKVLGDRLVFASKMSAKVDSAALQDGYELYHHCFFFPPAASGASCSRG